jgi:hypothetical protein
MELRGTLGDFSLEVIFGLISNGHKTGRLHLMLTGPDGKERDMDLSFADGAIVGVTSGALHGLDVLREAAVCQEGSFEFSIAEAVDAGGPADPIPMDAALAVMEAARTQAAALSAALSGTGGTVRHAFPSTGAITISPEEFRLLAVLRDGMSVEDVIAASSAPSVDAMRIIRQLVDRGLLALEGTETRHTA